MSILIDIQSKINLRLRNGLERNNRYSRYSRYSFSPSPKVLYLFWLRRKGKVRPGLCQI